MRRLLLGLVLSWGAQALALDASIPDASAGMGGADMTSEENEMRDPCLSAKDCDRGFSCTNGRCVPTPVRNAAGCGGGLAVSLVPLAGVVLLARRKR
ncbi:MAG: hypothetical protein IAE78_29010 [Myxococcus sp.]|nr:hypothetical protein [Myxococcus sp.]